MATDDRTRFEHFLRDLIEGRHAECAELLAPDVVWHVPPFAGQPPLEGREVVLDFLRAAVSRLYEEGSMRIEPDLVTVVDGQAACLATLRGRTRRGLPYDNRYAFFARMRDGLLCEVHELMDSARFLEQVQAEPEP